MYFTHIWMYFQSEIHDYLYHTLLTNPLILRQRNLYDQVLFSIFQLKTIRRIEYYILFDIRKGRVTEIDLQN